MRHPTKETVEGAGPRSPKFAIALPRTQGAPAFGAELNDKGDILIGTPKEPRMLDPEEAVQLAAYLVELALLGGAAGADEQFAQHRAEARAQGVAFLKKKFPATTAAPAPAPEK